ncbi:MAG: bifunctional phosphoribosyl-AMP cyclohydrolase/phosphoribosyl-ATP diphosphatase HisIE [Deltaproteobacteria bacterium]|nr:bifunctional phosphoribosyl-AMP cyclohydrolase/phosphoribosyl-ATP diphosphatase HisIE [Deltaproteobacteria bacterium]
MGEIDFTKGDGLVAAVIRDAGTGAVLMLAWMNEEALGLTLSTGKAHYYSRSRNKLWLKGETSGNIQEVRDVRYDCDADAILLTVEPKGPACHTGERTCFYRSLMEERERAPERPQGAEVIKELYNIVLERKKASPEKSYVASLYAKGLPKILEKVEEESGELIEAAREKGKADVVYEMSDLWFHTLVLLANEGIGIEEIFAELSRRFGLSGIEEKKSRGEKK